MHSISARLVGLLFAIAMVAGSASAAERVALVIGNDKYQHAPALKNAVRDAEAVAGALRRVGFASVNVAIDASRDTLTRALRDFGKEGEKADWAVIFFAGHGLEIGGVTYLVPTDAKLESDRDLEFEAVTLRSVLTAIAPKKLRLVIYDANRDNPFARTMRPGAGSRQGSADLDPWGPPTLVAYATKAGEVAQEGEGNNSPFTAALIKNLATPGLDVRVLFDRVRDDVMEATKRKQQPFIYGSLGADDLVFVPK